MNRQQIYTLSGALLASTALSGVATAATVGSTTDLTFSATALKVSNTIFSATAATADAQTIRMGGPTLALSFNNSFPLATKFNATINVTGAKFVTSGTYSPSILTRNPAGTGTFFSTVSGAADISCTAVTPLVDFLTVSGCGLQFSNGGTTVTLTNGGGATLTAGGLQISGVVFNTASALATAGNSITLSGTIVDNTNASQLFENITSGAIVTSAAPITVTVTPVTGSAIANATTTPVAFLNIASGGGVGAANGLTVQLATINITSTVARSTDLSTFITVATASANLAVSVTSDVLTATGVRLSLINAANAVTTLTPAMFSGSTATFTLATVAGHAGDNVLMAKYDGTTAIAAAAAGTVAVTFVANAGNTAPVGGSGTTTSVVRGGFSAEINTFQSSAGNGSSLFQSFLRIHNNGNASGAATITVRDDSHDDGSVLGSFDTEEIVAGGTLQLSAAAIEEGAGITEPAGQYTISVTGPLVGYVQHVMFNNANNAFSDLSSFRNGGSTTNVP